MSDHLPILLIVFPLLTAPLVVLLARARLAWPLAVLATWGSFGVSIATLSRVMSDGPIRYFLGGWAPPLGIEYRVDLLNAFILLIVTGVASVVLVFAPASLDREVPKSRHPYFYVAFLLCLTGLAGMTVTGDAFNVFVFLEISSLSMYTLISLGAQRQALMASFRYLVMGTIGGTFFLIAIGLLYMMTGTLNIADLAERIEEVKDTKTVRAALAFLTVGMGLKMALFPLHLWLPNAYAYAPSAVTAFLSATATKVSVYVFLRFVFGVFGVDLAFVEMGLGEVLRPLALAGIFVASTVAIFQVNVKRMLAYSSVAQIGYIVLGLSFASVAGVMASLIHVFNHALVKGGLFMAVGCFALRTGTTDLDDMRGLGRSMPLSAFAFVIGGLGLIGVPLTVGFVSKWYLVSAALGADRWMVAGLMLLSSLLAVVYIWRVVEAAYFQPPPEDQPRVTEAPWTTLAPTWVLIGASIYFGIDAELTTGLARSAAEMLIGVSP